MKNIIRKTKEEIEAKTTYQPIKVSDTHYFFWSCDDCKVAFFGDDIILKSSQGHICCPIDKQSRSIFQVLSTLISPKDSRCLNHIYGGDEECFNKYYKLA